MKRHWHRLACAAAVALLVPRAARAGMGSPLPSDIDTVLRLNHTTVLRLQTLSFFLVVLLACSVTFCLLWNWLRRDFPKLPRLTFFKACGVVLMWGLLFIIVLTMISGARELMTPGAWVKQGFTYRLAPEPKPEEASSAAARKKHLEQLRQALWQYAATHSGRFPAANDTGAVNAEMWTVPETGGLRYVYVADRTAADGAAVLLYEPEIDSEQRFVLLTNGEVVGMRSAELVLLLNGEKRP
jgi:hypothetical protein